MLKFKKDYPMSRITTLKIGGPAKQFVSVKTQADLLEATEYAKQNNMNYLVIGGGSNLLVNDKGLDKLVVKNEVAGIHTSKVGSLVPSEPVLSEVEVVEGDSFEVNVKSGTTLQALVDYTIKHGLAGLQKLTGIPGTVGGAVFGNAGAYGQTISDHLISVRVFNGQNISTLTKEQCEFSYRDSFFKRSGFTFFAKQKRQGSASASYNISQRSAKQVLQRNHCIILEVTFELTPANPNQLKQEAGDILSRRLIRYPPGLKCPGSFFKNILAETLDKKIISKIPQEKIPYRKVSAGYLLESVGAKTQHEGNIEVSMLHANLFVNKGGGKAADFYKLEKRLAKKVKQKFGITLEPEVQLINLPPIH